MNRRDWKAPLLALLLTTSMNGLAAERVQVVGLFKDKVVVRIDGQQRLLRVGQISPEGVKLISANSSAAVLEIDGNPVELSLDRGVGAQYQRREGGPQVRIYRNPRGMFTTVGTINGAPVSFLVDTGATQVAMNATMARRLGVDFRVEGDPAAVSTASGFTRGYRVRLNSVKVGAIELLNVDAMVLDIDHPMEVLLGMSFLGRLEMTNSNEVLVLQKKY